MSPIQFVKDIFKIISGNIEKEQDTKTKFGSWLKIKC